MFINTHTHQKLFDADIELINLPLNSNEKPNYYSYGIHPKDIEKENYNLQLEQLNEVVHEKHCYAIGECGLDKLCNIDFNLQTTIFIEQIKIANNVKKPLIIHCVKAFNELINCLNINNNKIPVIIHGFNNNEKIAGVLEKENYYFSFGKSLLNFESNAAKTIKCIGRKTFFLETDSADISIKYIYKKASELLGIDEEILKYQLKNNFENVFKLKL